MGVWFQVRLDNLMEWVAKRYDIEIASREEKWLAQYPLLAKRIVDLEKEVAKLKKDKKFEKIYDIVEKVMIDRKNIHPNVDYPTGPTYHLMGFDTDFFTPIFVISRITGWSAHIMEQHSANKLIRPLASYKGSQHRKVVPINQR